MKSVVSSSKKFISSFYSYYQPNYYKPKPKYRIIYDWKFEDILSIPNHRHRLVFIKHKYNTDEN